MTSSLARGFLALPNPPGRATPDEVTLISGDGSTIGGAAVGTTLKPALWRPDGQVIVLGDGNTEGRVQVISYDGQVAAGTLGTGGPTGVFRWTASSQFVDIGNPGGYRLIGVRLMSKNANAMVVAGRQIGPDTAYFPIWRWSQSDGFSQITVPEGSVTWVTGISDDGQVVSGMAGLPFQGPSIVWRWSVTDGYQQIGSVPNPSSYTPSVPLVSGTGQVIVFPRANPTIRIVRWANGVGTDLPIPAGKVHAHPTAVSADGNTILGYATDANGGNAVAFCWTAGDNITLLGTTGASPWYFLPNVSLGAPDLLWFSPDETKIFGRTLTGIWSWDSINGLQTINPPGGTPKLVSQNGDIFVRRDNEGTFLRWSSPSGTTVSLGSLSENSRNTILRFSGDGTAAYGASSTYDGISSHLSYWRWTPGSGYLPATLLPNTTTSVLPGANWEDGRRFSGVDLRSTQGPDTWWEFVPWRWTDELGLKTEPAVAIPGVVPWDYPSVGLSADGLTAVINIGSDDGERPLMLWTRKNGFRSLSPIAAVDPQNGISRDASVIAGYGGEAFWIWSVTDAFTPLPAPTGYTITSSFKLSADGKIALASAWNQATRQNSLLRWTRDTGLQVIPIVTEPRDWTTFTVTRMSADGSTVAGTVTLQEIVIGYAQRAWRWSVADGFEILGIQDQMTVVNSVSPDGSVIYGSTLGSDQGWRWTRATGLTLVKDDFPPNNWAKGSGLISTDGTVVAGSNTSPLYTEQSWIAAYAPVIDRLSPQSAISGDGDVSVVIYGVGFESATKVTVGQIELTPDSISPTEIHLTIPASLNTTILDFISHEVQVVCPGGDVSRPAGFTVIGSTLGDLVTDLETAVATTGTTATVEIPPATPSSGGVSAALTVNSTDTAASVTVATYNGDPSGSGNTSFDVAGSYVDLNASGVTSEDSLQAFFYFPAGTPVERLILKFWNTRLSPPDWDTVSPVTVQEEVHRVDVVFNATSHPSITELDGTFFAPVVLPPIQFTGFLSPINGADTTGGSVTSPLRTFKLGSTVPVKFTATQGGAAVASGLQTLQVQLCSTSTTTASAIDATPQGNATTGNQFRYTDGQWHFNLDTKATGMTKGVWKVTATLSDQSQHSVWIQLK